MVDLASEFTVKRESQSLGAFQGTIECLTDRLAALDYVSNMPGDVLATGYQNSVFLRAWLSQETARPFFVIIRQTGRGDVLLPLELSHNGVAVYCGGTHANGNFPVGHRDDIEALSAAHLKHIIASLGKNSCSPDAIYLERQHSVWQGCRNPFVDDSSTTSPNVALSLSLEGGFSDVLDRHHGKRKRKRQRNHMRKLEALGSVTIDQHVPCDQVNDILSVFYKLKATRFREAGICDVFAETSVQKMFSQMFMESCASENPRHVLKALRLDGQPIAIIGCTIIENRITVEFGAFDDAFAAGGPGDLLFYHAIEHACAQGLRIFDFGIGDEFYKRSWCEIETWHQDTILAVSTKGKIRASLKRARNTTVHAIKTNDVIWQTIKKLRKHFSFLRRC